ncbi:IS3 family transposase [Enterocloster clostridioformis]
MDRKRGCSKADTKSIGYVLKKDPGINTETLKDREKAVIVDALKDKYPLPLLLGKLGLPKSSYYYQEAKRQRQDKYSNIRKKIFALFHENSGRYGYRRIHALLIREGITVSEKVVRRLMAEEGLVVLVKSTRKYNSYQGGTLSLCAKYGKQGFPFGKDGSPGIFCAESKRNLRPVPERPGTKPGRCTHCFHG